MKVPFLDLDAHHRPYREEFARAIQEVVDKGAFAGGPFVKAFEDDFAPYCGCGHAVGVASGTDALWLSLLALGVGPGDEVITVPSTFIATAEAITYVGAKPVFVDIEEGSYTMDPAALEAAVTPRTAAIIPVHLFGQMADMNPILAIAERHGIPVVEDAAQAHGAEYHGRRAGSMGALGCFSFYPGKNLGAFGEGGAVTTNDPELAARVRMFLDHGQVKKYYHQVVGWNGRMDGIQGAVLQIKLRNLDTNNDLRAAHAAAYDQALAGIDGIVTPQLGDGRRHVRHIYPVRVADRDAVLAELTERGIGCGIHYPVPVHLQEAYADLGHAEGEFPVSERTSREFLSLPMFPELTSEQIAAVVSAVTAVMGARVAA